MRRHARLAAIFLALLLLAAGATPATGAGIDIAIQSVEPSVDQPAPGERFTLTVTVTNLQTTGEPVEVTDVWLREADSAREYARVENMGTIPAGGSLAVPLTVRFTDRGGKQLTVHARVENESGEYTRVAYPVYIEVAEPDEAVISFADIGPVAGQEDRINVTVANGDVAPLSNVRLDVTGNAQIQNPERVTAALQSGTQTVFPYRVTFADPGPETLEATLTYKTGEGYTRTITRAIAVTVEPPVIDTGLTASVTTAADRADIEVTLTEYGNVELRDVEVQVLADAEVVARTLVPDVPEKGSRTVALDGREVPSGDVTVRAIYTAAGERQTTETALRYRPAADAAVSLTGLEVTRLGNVTILSGNVVNEGNAPATAVLVELVESAGVSPITQKREAFVGPVEASGAQPWDVAATVSDGASIPLRLEYTVGGERFAEVVPVDVTTISTQTQSITLTGVELARDGAVMTIGGDAANVGTVDATAVLVRVVPADGVQPVGPKREYFVGAIGSSEFARFELTANVSDSAAAIPVEVQYTIRGVRVTETIPVDASASMISGPERNGTGSSPALLVAVGAIVLLAAGLGVYLWRRR